jgi:hypothetical protein
MAYHFHLVGPLEIAFHQLVAVLLFLAVNELNGEKEKFNL